MRLLFVWLIYISWSIDFWHFHLKLASTFACTLTSWTLEHISYLLTYLHEKCFFSCTLGLFNYFKPLKIISLIYFKVAEINNINKISLDNMAFFHNYLYKFWENAWFFDRYAMKKNLQNKIQITFFLMASQNIDFDLVCHVIGYT